MDEAQSMDEAQKEAKAAELQEIRDWQSLSDEDIAALLHVDDMDILQDIKNKAQREQFGVEEP